MRNVRLVYGMYRNEIAQQTYNKFNSQCIWHAQTSQHDSVHIRKHNSHGKQERAHVVELAAE